MNNNLIDKIALAIVDNEFDNTTYHRKTPIYQAKAIYTAIKEAGYAIVQVEPTQKMLIDVGPVEGFDFETVGADKCHTEWWKAMIKVAEDEDCQATGDVGPKITMGPSKNGSKNCANAEGGRNGSVASGGTVKYCTCDVCF